MIRIGIIGLGWWGKQIVTCLKESPRFTVVAGCDVDHNMAAPFAREPYQALLDYARAGTAWTGSDAQLLVKAAGLAHLIVGSGDYQLV